MIIPLVFIVINILTALLVIPQNLETFYLVFKSVFYQSKKEKQADLSENTDYPLVSIQLPVYNEGRNVIDLLATVSRINYPRNRLEILVLDDSDDETSKIIEDEISKLIDKGFSRIDICRRSSRSGHKAGNLQNGLQNTEAPYIAVFDADFRPADSFLNSTMPLLVKRPSLAAVQANWSSYNENDSILTRFLAQGVRHNFAMKKGRQQLGAKLMINGSAFVLRKSTLEELGSWETDTLTEDLDLSIRLQESGYKIAYVENEVCPQQLVATLPAFSRQQQRWTKGYSQCLRKHWKSALKDHHLMFLLTLYMMSVLAIINVTSLCLAVLTGGGEILFDPRVSPYLIVIYGLVSTSLGLNYLSYVLANARSLKQAIESVFLVFVMAIVGLGIGFRLAIKNVTGLFFKGGSFDRTIKAGQIEKQPLKMPFFTEIILLALYSGTVVVLWSDYGIASAGIISYLLLFMAGTLAYLYSAIKSLF
ncbi:MAG: glycosyltransferase family 2 protein [Candidatus Odinarchaeota archaeon]